MQLVADDLHVRSQQAKLPSGFPRDRLAKAVILPDQVDTSQRLVVLEYRHQCRHAHVGMSVKTEVPEAAFFIGKAGINRRVVEKKHTPTGFALIVLVDGIDQGCGDGRRIPLHNEPGPFVDR